MSSTEAETSSSSSEKESNVKWKFLEHRGPVFAPPYEQLPNDVKFLYDGKEMQLSIEAEEVAGFYAKMLDHEYTKNKTFNDNFFNDWRECMTPEEREEIVDLSKCNFKNMHGYFKEEKKKNQTEEKKKKIKTIKEYGFCTIDGRNEKIANFKIEPPGLFRGRGNHPKMGKLKRRVEPEDIIINCSRDSKIPIAPNGHEWKEVRYDSSVTWLASWTENILKRPKYIKLDRSSKLKGKKDKQKFKTAQRLHESIDEIRKQYCKDLESNDKKTKQRAVALYFIDKLALRAGNKKGEDEADTVGCCSLRVEHIQLHEHKDDKDYVVVFNFLGKGSIFYNNEVPVEKLVYENLQEFMENKEPGDDLFDLLSPGIINAYLKGKMEGLTVKVFRTYNASFTLQQELEMWTNANDSTKQKILTFKRENIAVAKLLNHQRQTSTATDAGPSGNQKFIKQLQQEIDSKRENIRNAERQKKDAKQDAEQLVRLRKQLEELEMIKTDTDPNKTIAENPSKLNYLDPRIIVAWCKKYDVPIEKIFSSTQRDIFRWAIDTSEPPILTFEFLHL